MPSIIISADDPVQFLIVDGTNIAHRLYSMIKGQDLMVGPNKEAIAISHGVLSNVLSVVERYHPTHLAIVFDGCHKTFRHDLYAGYKEGRPPKEENLLANLRQIETLLEGTIGITAPAGYEADDVIATLCQDWQEEALVYSADRDLLQLVDGRVKALCPAKNAPLLLDVPQVVEVMGVLPKQIVDYKALAGDTTDKIPGVKGIGKTIALDLLHRFDNLEDIYAHIGLITGPPYTKLKPAAARESAMLSKQLAQLKTDVPLEMPIFPRQFNLNWFYHNFGSTKEKWTALGLKAIADRYDHYLLDRYF